MKHTCVSGGPQTINYQNPMQTEHCHGNLQPSRRLFVSSLTFQEICILLKPPSLIRFLKYNIMLLEGIRPLI